MTARKEYGDFQTPQVLAEKIVSLISRQWDTPELVIEPTAGLGSFLEAACKQWPNAMIKGYEINSSYVQCVQAKRSFTNLSIEAGDFFLKDWGRIIGKGGSERVLVLGNPPWVLNSSLGAMYSQNLPQKSNFQGLGGFDAKTGKSNFDISEWMLIKLIENLSLAGRLAMLCKQSTARKVLQHFWKTRGGFDVCEVRPIDAKVFFGVAVEACLLQVSGKSSCKLVADVFEDLESTIPTSSFGLIDGRLVSDIDSYRKSRALDGGSAMIWRSGIKHDLSKIMEFSIEDNRYKNGNGQLFSLEPTYLYPLLKSSDIANENITPRRYVLVTQKKPGESTDEIRVSAPLTWQYLQIHKDNLRARKSSIYNGHIQFGVFGVGDYSFSTWKVAISGLYKNFRFVVVPPHEGRPVMLDDTCYFVPVNSKPQADFLAMLLNSEPNQTFLRSLVFRDAKRPITVEVLRRLSPSQIANELGQLERFYDLFLVEEPEGNVQQQYMAFEEKGAYPLRRKCR